MASLLKIRKSEPSVISFTSSINGPQHYPQGTGQAEASNKTLIKIIKNIVNNKGRDWHLQLYLALWAYRTSIRTPTGATPYSLVFGAEAILPVEIELPSLHISL
eukprot:Gb_03764 [translate_table: standard]